MKFRHLVSLFVLSLTTTPLFASIAIKTPSQLGQNCTSFAGGWNGYGYVVVNIFVPIRCAYRGTAYVTSVGPANFYNVHVDLDKDKGRCPPGRYSFELPGTCQDGFIHLQTDQADLEGDMNSDGTEVKLHGTVKVTFNNVPIVADVEEMKLEKM